jgi:hypothetical protein
MSASETPLSDKASQHEWIGNCAYMTVKLSDCRAIERRLNDAVDALGEMVAAAESQGWHNAEIANAREAIANARKQL